MSSDRVPDEQPTPRLSPQPGSRSTRTIDGYRLLQKIGEGGMGEVWEAEQQHPVRRRVALKLVKWGMDTREVIARFESERQALALMDHPTIAKVFDAGATDQGRPYFAMEFVKGVPITEYADTQRLTTRERLALMVQVCHGIQHAHQKGIIHRDIKPSNVLVTLQDGAPTPRIIDFGVAKATAQRLTERTVFTELGQWVGTPEYMSPEQAEMTGIDVDTRTDVYSLGVLQYELLTGSLPFEGRDLRRAGFDEMRRRIREDEPTRPSTKVSGRGQDSETTARNRQTDLSGLTRELHGDLDWITMKALEKDRTRRYESPSDLAADLERHLCHEPVEASPPSALYRISKFTRRHRAAAAAAALVTVALLMGAAAATVGLLRAQREARTARQVSSFLVGMFNDLNPGGARRAASTPREMLGRGVERIEVELAGQPEVQAQLLTAMGSAYRGLGHAESARRALDKATALHREVLGRASPSYAMTISIRGDLATEMGDHEEARRLHEEALAIRRETLGPEHRSVGWSLRSLAFGRWRMADYEGARRLYAEALEINRRARGAESLDAATTLRLQALLEQEIGEYERAETLFLRALEMLEETAGPRHTELAWCLVDYSLLLHRLGRYDDSLAASSRAEEVFEALLGPDHPSVATAIHLNAIVRRDMGDGPGARSRLERALLLLEAIPDEEPLLRGWVLNELGRGALLDGDLEEARLKLERSLPLLEAHYGPDHPQIAFPLSHLGATLSRSGDQAAALPLFERSLELREKSLGPDHPEVAWTLRPWAAMLRRGGDTEGARRLLDRTLEITTNAFGNNHPEVAQTLAAIAFLEYRLGDLEESTLLYQRILPIRETVFGPDHPALAVTLFNMACLATLQGEEAAALGHLTRAVDVGYSLPGIFDDPDLDPLRGEPEFAALLDRVRERRGGD